MNDEEVRRLLELGATQGDPPADVGERIEAVARRVWRELPSPAVRWHRPVLAVAASVALVSGLAWLAFVPATAVPVAEVVHATSGYSIEDSRSDAPHVTAGATLRTDSTGRVLVTIDSATFVRVDRRSSLQFAGPGRLLLRGGRVFVDSDGGGVTVETVGGVRIKNVGTQFEVAVGEGEAEVGVREGRVDISFGQETVAAEAREGIGEVVVVGSGRIVSRTPVKSTDARWTWIHGATPAFELDAATVHDFLVWATREAGLELAFASRVARARASRVTLHGSPVEADGLGRAAIGEILETVPSLRVVESADHRLVVARSLPESNATAPDGGRRSGERSETATSGSREGR